MNFNTGETSMDYARETVAPSVAIDRPYLSRISDAADEAARIGDYVQDFIDRCRGCGLDQAKTGPTPVPSGHFGQLDRLSENLSRVDRLARELQTIG